ncbi:MAG: hypothetical protein Q4A27_00045 [bacterium]|nr:hypothetical protein [bacterium]
MKYFLVNSTGLVVGVPESVKVGSGEEASGIVEQYQARPEEYTPCDKSGKPLAVEKAKKTEKVEE